MTRWLNAVAGFLTLTVVACAVYEKKQPVVGDKAIVDAYVRAWNQHDTVALDTLLAPDGIHEDVAQNYRGVGTKAVIKFMRGVVKSQPDYKWTVTNEVEYKYSVCVPVTSVEVIRMATQSNDRTLQEALEAALFKGELKPHPLGRWLARHLDRVVNGMALQQVGERKNGAIWRLKA